MNDRELREKRNQSLRNLVQEDRKKVNKLDIHRQNSKRHEKKKFEICWDLLQREKQFVTEARFKDRDLRADIYVLDDDEIHEVETSKQELMDRKDKYPRASTYVWPLYSDEEVFTLQHKNL
jgi:hypothetical protein